MIANATISGKSCWLGGKIFSGRQERPSSISRTRTRTTRISPIALHRRPTGRLNCAPVIAAAAPPARRAAGAGFALADTESAPPQSATVALRTIGGIDALIALQGIEEPAERRRRAVARGRTALDALDELKIGLLAGEFDAGTLVRLRSSLSGLKDGSGDPILDSVLAEIELRVEVELAKMEPREER